MARERCMIFVDDSNVWIEAQKFAASGNSHMPKLNDTDRDPRLRIDIGMLVEMLLSGRIQGPSFLYGSRPPPNDSVWEAFKKKNFDTNIYNRDGKGKEKEVDNSMSADMSEKATELRVLAEQGDRKAREERDNITFVVITGDRDMLPAVKKILIRCGIRVELWAWKAGISNEYLKLQSEVTDLFSVRLLDSIFKDISFTAFRSTRKVKTVVGGKTIVLCNVDPSEENAVCDRLLNTRELFWTTRFDGEVGLCIEFPRVDQLDRVIKQARQLLPGITILSWPEYRAKFNKGSSEGETVRSSNIYELLEEPPSGKPSPSVATKPQLGEYQTGAGSGETAKTVGQLRKPDENDGGGWETVIGKSNPDKRHRRVVNQKQDCPYGMSCKKKEDCNYRHTDKEKRTFQEHQNTNLGLRKTRLCHNASTYCQYGRNCLFAHSEAEARCLDCKQTGHFRGDVRKCPLQA